jgi:hypothetical protein
MRHVSLIEIGFTGRSDFSVVRYSVNNNGLRSNNRFRFQGDVGTHGHSYIESMYNVFTPIFLIPL